VRTSNPTSKFHLCNKETAIISGHGPAQSRSHVMIYLIWIQFTFISSPPSRASKHSHYRKTLAKKCYHVHTSKPPVSVLSEMNRFKVLVPYFFEIHFNIIVTSVPRSQVASFKLVFRLKCYSYFCPICATCSAQLIALDLITLTICGKSTNYEDSLKVCDSG
jgi:hypothetical protein